MCKVPKVITVPSHPSNLLSPEILRPGKRSCPQPPPSMCPDSQRCVSCTVTESMRGLVQLGPHQPGSEIWLLMQTTQSERDLPRHPTPLPPRLWSQAHKEWQVSSGLCEARLTKNCSFFQVCGISYGSLGSGSCMITWDFPSIHLKMQL